MQAQKNYPDFVKKGIGEGRRPELVGGGLIRSLGGWRQAKTILKGSERIKGDERILGDSDFVLTVLEAGNEQLERRQLIAKGIDLQILGRHAAKIYDVRAEQLFAPGRYPKVVLARSLLCFWAVRHLGMQVALILKSS